MAILKEKSYTILNMTMWKSTHLKIRSKQESTMNCGLISKIYKRSV
ncbi:MAG: hypothetical protein UDG85_09585 [Anaerostipes hadrus]|nr:hypothetical protein [Anaerostipes hadrus]